MSQRHRSHWTARIQNPSLNPHRFLPTPLPAKPLNQVKPAKVETPREIAPTPSRTAGEWRIFDRYNNYRSKISEDGTCTNNCNEVIGFLNIDGAQAGTIDEQYLGCVNADWQIEDDQDVVVGSIDPGRALIRDASGSIIVEMDNAGAVSGEDGSYLGQFEGFTYRQMKTIALYMVFIDPGMLSCIEG